MPKPALSALVWSQTNRTYDLLANGVFQQPFAGEDEKAWQGWLETQTGFSFQGQWGHLNVLKEARSRGTGYWYAYASNGQRQIKRYLGKTRTITLARLEEIATALTRESALSAQSPAPQPSEVFSPPSTPFPLLGLSEPAPFSDFLLLPKLSPPRLPGTLVTRERLMAQLDQALTHGLTLLSASAGFGKTTLLASWATRCPCPVAWLSLEEQDNNPMRFWSYVIAALRTSESTLGETTLSMLHAPQPPTLATILTTLINDLVAGQEEQVLVLDDYHVIDDPAITSSFQFLFKHLPPRLHLILAGRTDPPLALPRLRARGQVAEIRDRDLRFTRAEAARFLIQAMKLPLLEAEVDILEQRTEGWIVGLQLAALAMHAREDCSTFVQQLNGSQRFILEYMQEEILELQPQALQNFLLHTAVLTRLHASLCQAVTAGATEQASQHLLQTLEKANLFLVPLDEERRWYRLHGLFRDVLQARLHALSPELVPLLHQRAARWYAQQGDLFEAVEHALAGNDYEFAIDLMERSAVEMWSNGQGEMLSNWLRRLPDAFLLAHGRLVLTGFLYLLNHTFYALDEQWNAAVNRVEQTIAHMEHLLNQEPVALPEGRLLYNRIALLRGWITTRDLQPQRNIEQKRCHTAQMQELAREDDSVWKMIPLFNLVSWQPDIIALLPLFFALKQQAELEDHEYEAIRIMAWICAAYEQAGQLHQAEQLYREGLQRLQRMGKARAMSGYFHLDLARLQWKWNRPDEAQSHLTAAMKFARTWQHVDIQIKGYYLFFQILLALGKHVEAAQVLTEAEHCIQHSQEDLQRPWTTVMRGQYWLAQNNLAATADWVVHLVAHLPPIDFYYQHSEYFTTLVRAYLALQRQTEALQLVATLLSQAECFQRKGDIISFLALQVVAFHNSGEMLLARQAAVRMLTLTGAGGSLRVYLDMGQPMQQVLQSLLNIASAQLECADVPVPIASLRNLLAGFERQARQAPHTESPASSLPSSLTTRELEVLHLLAQGQTNQEIAAHLVVSLATAKKHVANILGKLEAENRVQAIARAREYKLL